MYVCVCSAFSVQKSKARLLLGSSSVGIRCSCLALASLTVFKQASAWCRHGPAKLNASSFSRPQVKAKSVER